MMKNSFYYMIVPIFGEIQCNYRSLTDKLDFYENYIPQWQSNIRKQYIDDDFYNEVVNTYITNNRNMNVVIELLECADVNEYELKYLCDDVDNIKKMCVVENIPINTNILLNQINLSGVFD